MIKDHYSKQDWHCDDFGLRSPVIQETFWQKCATSIAERVRKPRHLQSRFKEQASRILRSTKRAKEPARSVETCLGQKGIPIIPRLWGASLLSGIPYMRWKSSDSPQTRKPGSRRTLLREIQPCL